MAAPPDGLNGGGRNIGGQSGRAHTLLADGVQGSG